jgi:tetratricopeptide (TPR) repeat protein
MLIILLSIGLVLTAILSWIYDITPEGIRKTEDENGGLPTFVRRDSRGAVQDSETEPGQRSWFRRHRVFRRYLLPLSVFAVLFLVIRFWEPLFNNPNRLKEEAMIHAQNAKIYLSSSANLEMVKGELDLALALDSNCASALNTYGMVYLMEGDTLKAKRYLHRAVQSDPTHSTAWSSLAAFAILEDSIDLALGYTFKAVESDSKNANAAYTMAAQLRKMGRDNEAVEWYRKAIQMDSTFTEASSALGALYNDLDRPVEAILVLQQSLSLVPGSPQNFRIYKNLAEAHFILGEYDRALGYLGQSKSMAPEFPETEKCYARLYEATGETGQSIQHWQRFMILETDSMLLVQAQQHLDSLRSITSN